MSEKMRKKNRLSKKIGKTAVYVVLIIGTVVMLLPFVWMLITSFQFPNESNSFPPVWFSKNFLFHRYIAHSIDKSTINVIDFQSMSLQEWLSFNSGHKKHKDTLNLVLDDYVRTRGIMTITFNNPTYLSDKYALLITDNLKKYDKPLDPAIASNISKILTLENLQDVVSQLFGTFEISDKAIFLKGNFYKHLRSYLKTEVSNLNKIEQKHYDRFLTVSSDDSESLKVLKLKARNILYSQIAKITKNASDLMYITSDMKNSSRLLKADELNKFRALMLSCTPSISSSDLLAFKSNRKIYFPIRKMIEYTQPIEDLSNTIDFYLQFRKAYFAYKTATLKSKVVKFRFFTRKEMENYALKQIDKLLPPQTIEELKKYRLEDYPKQLLLEGFKPDLVNEVSYIIADARTQVHVITKPPEVESIRFKSVGNTDTVVISFYKINPVNFYFDKTAMEVNYNFIEVVKNVFQNYVDAWNSAPFGIYFMNSVLVAGASTIVEVIFAILAAFAFAKLQFAGKEILFSLLLMTMMIPGEVLLVPNYISLTKLGWIDTYYALITPWLVSVFTIFLMRQFFMSIPQELFEAAKIDGCTPTRFLWQILVPLSKPVIVTAALLKFVGSWNSFLWVLIVTKSPKMRTLPVGLQNFQSEAGTDYNLLMAASAISIIPVLIIFFFAQKQFIRGIAKTGIK